MDQRRGPPPARRSHEDEVLGAEFIDEAAEEEDLPAAPRSSTAPKRLLALISPAGRSCPAKPTSSTTSWVVSKSVIVSLPGWSARKMNDVGAAEASEHVVALAPVDRVAGIAADDRIIALVAEQIVRACVARPDWRRRG